MTRMLRQRIYVMDKMSFMTFIMLIFFSTNTLRKVEADIANVTQPETTNQQDDWFVTREMWRARNYNNTEKTDAYKSLRLVIVHDTITTYCNRILICASELRQLQSYYISNFNYDIRYNFLIGNDGRVYEGRGWNIVGAHTTGYNDCSLGLAFMGEYSDNAGFRSFAQVTELQQQRARMLFEEGVKLGYLHPKFHVLAARDLRQSYDIYSPGLDLYKVIKTWSNYDKENRYKNRTCDQIQELFKE